MKKPLLGLTLAAVLAAPSAFALQLDGNISATATVTNKANALAPATKRIVLMNVKLTPAEKKLLTTLQPSTNKQTSTTLPGKVDLGMNNVPVLDQGQHGAC